ncbi:DMT family transporter [Pikeienuella piscinae]|uniref:DMT family transporter n=1 Tax=Pikeienuella piscinae TaxID=2748098 RepID=A0A7L5BY17_9RHOB|nr:DMT family transporter [Pikeienuella piscinae]QIE56341.1 DMT family transporter [Pikeienuella piscinae]
MAVVDKTLPAPFARVENIAAGVAWMLLSGLLFVAMTGIVRYLGSSLPAAETAFIRYALGFLLVSPALIGVFRRPPSRRVWGLYAGRGLVHGVGVILWFYAMARIPIAEVTALSYVQPILVTILAAFILGERLRARRIVAVLAGLMGVLIILRPGFQEIGLGQLAQIAAGPLFAASFIFAKMLTNETRPTEIVAMLSLVSTLTLLPFALADWRPPSLHDVLWLALVALVATAGHYALTRAYQCAPITVTQPVIFLQIVWATILGAAFFDEGVDAYVVVGAGIIVCSAWYIAIREMKSKGKATIPTAGPSPTASGGAS